MECAERLYIFCLKTSLDQYCLFSLKLEINLAANCLGISSEMLDACLFHIVSILNDTECFLGRGQYLLFLLDLLAADRLQTWFDDMQHLVNSFVHTK